MPNLTSSPFEAVIHRYCSSQRILAQASNSQCSPSVWANRKAFSCAAQSRSRWQDKVAKKRIKEHGSIENWIAFKNRPFLTPQSSASSEELSYPEAEEARRPPFNEATRTAKDLHEPTSFRPISLGRETFRGGQRDQGLIRRTDQFTSNRRSANQTYFTDKGFGSNLPGNLHAPTDTRDHVTTMAHSELKANRSANSIRNAPENRSAPPSWSQHQGEQGVQRRSQQRGPKYDEAVPKPSASVLVISPKNEVLLIHRVRNSSSFPSAHVFPGGNVDVQDGDLPDSGLERHQDSLPYRYAAIRELFEETGILLAKNETNGDLLELNSKEIASGRHWVHSGDVQFKTWLDRIANEKRKNKRQKSWINAVPDTDRLIPFTHWLTPTNVDKRFSTQMYLYFLPFDESPSSQEAARDPSFPLSNEELAPPNTSILPSSDGGLENTAAEFALARQWLERAKSGDIILFPPQYLLLHLVSQHLDTPTVFRASKRKAIEHYKAQRQKLRDFVEKDGDPPWTSKFISPWGLMYDRDDRKVVLGLDKPGIELTGYPCKGDSERVILVRFEKKVPRDVEVRSRKEVFEEQGLNKMSEFERLQRSKI